MKSKQDVIVGSAEEYIGLLDKLAESKSKLVRMKDARVNIDSEINLLAEDIEEIEEDIKDALIELRENIGDNI